jgi:hypothetical protein
VKDKYGSDYEEGDGDDDEEDSEELESEDEDGDELTPAMDAAILRTLARIKRKDPAIYDAEKGVFDGMFFGSCMLQRTDISNYGAEERAALQNAQPTRKRIKENKVCPFLH